MKRAAWLVASLSAVAGCGAEPDTVAAAERPSGVETSRAPEATGTPGAGASDELPARGPVELGRALRAETGDLDVLLESRRVRVLVPYEHPYFFFDEQGPRGITFEMFREFGSFLEQREDLGREGVTVVYVPCELDRMLPWLEEGRGDIAAGGLTITPERRARVAFTEPLLEGVAEIVVASRDAPPVASIEQLAGREVWVAAGSSYAEHLAQLRERLVSRGLAPIAVREAPRTLSTEDLLEMVHAGIFELTVCDGYKARLWAEVLDGCIVRDDLVVNEGGALAFAVRRDNPELLETLDAFVPDARKGSLLGNILMKRYFGSTKWITHPGDTERRAELQRYFGWMRALGDEYGFDWRRIAAQCYQESGLDPTARSSAGALGLMQLLPATAQDMGCDDPLDPEQGLRAGVRYLDWLRTHFFADPELDDVERVDFILAAYNAGPGNVRKWRAEAPGRGLDPDRWRDHVERIALERVGIQPVRYVDNIEKYYVAYTLALDLAAERAEVPKGR